MSQKYENLFQLNWSSTPNVPFNRNTPLSSALTGTMSGTNVIYSNVQTINTSDNQGLEVTWTGNPTGVIEVDVSNSGLNFYPLTFSPALQQPSGSAGGYVINLNQVPFRYVMIKYTNTSGTGVLSMYIQSKDLN